MLKRIIALMMIIVFMSGYLAFAEASSAEVDAWKLDYYENGNTEAAYNVGKAYYNGSIIPRDYAQAVKWYTFAAEQGDARAQNNLGICYYNGFGVEQNFEEAVKWYVRAAEQGFAIAQVNLGGFYSDGVHAPKDLEEAVKWYTLAAEQGNTDAQKQLEKLNGVTPQPTATPTPKPTANPYTMLKRGDSGEAVKKLQNKLIEMNYLAKGEADGHYGAATSQAVHLFILSNMSDDHGCPDEEHCPATPEMQALMYSGNAESNIASPYSSKDRTPTAEPKNTAASAANMVTCPACGGKGRSIQSTMDIMLKKGSVSCSTCGGIGKIAVTPTPKPTSASGSTGTQHTTLKRGSKGEWVKKLQQNLINLNYLAKGEADGVYGAVTAKAVHNYKAANGKEDDCSSPDQCSIHTLTVSMMMLNNPVKYSGTPLSTPKQTSSSSSSGKKSSGSSKKSGGGSKCKSCGGTGKCGHCRNGRNPSNNSQLCGMCVGSKRCSSCGGDGRR